MYYYLGMPLRDVAESLDLPVGTAKSRLFRALETRVRSALDSVLTALPSWRAAGMTRPTRTDRLIATSG